MPAIAGSAVVGLDNSSPEAFIRSVAPYAARVSKATGIPAEALIGMAANETGYGKYAAGNNLFGIKGTGPAGTFSTPTWEDYGNGPVTITDNFRAYHSPSESFLDFAALVTTSPRYKGAMGQTTVEGFVNGLRQGGYMTDPDYVNKISGITTRYSAVIQSSLRDSGGTASGGRGVLVGAPGSSAPPVFSASASPAPSAVGQPGQGVVVPNQLAIGLPTDEALAACGPVAAMAFAQVFGRNPSPQEAMTLAKQSGWTSEGGMNGISNEKRLLDKMGLPSQLEMGANWDHIRADAMQKQPVILSTPGHYYVIDGYNPATGAYHVGQSGKVYRGGSDWLTPNQIAALSGSPSGALFTVHGPGGGPSAPGTPSAPSGTRQVLPPQVQTGQREVLPPMDLGNTPPPPPIPPAPAPTPTPPPPDATIVQPLDAPTPPPATAAPAPPPTPVASPPTPATPSPPPPTPAAPPPPPVVATPPPAPAFATPPATPVAATPPAAAGFATPPATPVAATSPPAPAFATPQPPIAPPPVPAAAAPPPVAAPPADATIVEPLDPTPPSQAQQPSAADSARPAIPGAGGGALAVGAVAANLPRQNQPPPPPPRRRPDEDDLDTA